MPWHDIQLKVHVPAFLTLQYNFFNFNATPSTSILLQLSGGVVASCVLHFTQCWNHHRRSLDQFQQCPALQPFSAATQKQVLVSLRPSISPTYNVRYNAKPTTYILQSTPYTVQRTTYKAVR
jgi:hypothetical protein